MHRITISLEAELGEALDAMVRQRGYASRSEAMRDLVRDGLGRWREEEATGDHCVASLSYIVDSRIRSLPLRLANMQHEHHDMVIASTVVRLDHDHSLETVILRGTAGAVRAFSDQVRAERGVRFGAINMLSVQPSDDHHSPEAHAHSGHQHLSPSVVR